MYTSSIACSVTMVTSIANWWLPSTFLAVKRFSNIFLSEGWECWLTENHFRVKFPKYFHSSPYVLGKNMKEILSIKLFAFWYLYFVSPWYIFIGLGRKFIFILFHETWAFFYNWPICTFMPITAASWSRDKGFCLKRLFRSDSVVQPCSNYVSLSLLFQEVTREWVVSKG